MKSYLDMIETVLRDGSIRFEPRTSTNIKSVFGYHFKHNMSEGFPLLTTKKMSIRSILVELEWFIRGRTDLKWLLDRGCNIWIDDAFRARGWEYEAHLGKPKGTLTKDEFVLGVLSKNPEENDDFGTYFSEDGCSLGPIYGSQWRNVVGIDQLSNLIDGLVKNPYSRRHLVDSWNVDEMEFMALPPCHYSFQCFVRDVDGKRYLDLNWIQRSADLMLGVPYNIASYATLLLLLCEETGYLPGVLGGFFGDLHIYEEHIPGALKQLERSPLPLCEINLGNNPKVLDFDSSSISLVNYISHDPIKFNLFT